MYNTLGSGFAKVVSQFSKVTVVVRPFAGPEAWLPSVNKGEMELGAISPFTAWQAYNAADKPYTTPVTNFRLLRSGKETNTIGFVVTQKSGIKSIKDLKGKKVPSGFGGHTALMRAFTSEFKTEGLEWSDVIQVPVTGAVEVARAFEEGRTDVAWGPLGMPALRELDVKTGIRYLPVKGDPQSLEILRRYAFPGVQVIPVKKGAAPGVVEDIMMMTYDSYLISWAALDDETVTSLLNTLWEHTNDLFQIHPTFKGFTKEVAVTSLPVIPYHPAAIRFYKEKGGWREEGSKILK